MSGAAIVRALLAQHQPLLDLAPAGKVFAGIAKQGTPLPTVVCTTISESEQGTTARNLPRKMIRERVQVTVLVGDGDYVLLKKIMKATALGAGIHRGTVAGFRVNSVMPWGVGPEIPPASDRILEQSRDFMVTFTEAN